MVNPREGNSEEHPLERACGSERIVFRSLGAAPVQKGAYSKTTRQVAMNLDRLIVPNELWFLLP